MTSAVGDMLSKGARPRDAGLLHRLLNSGLKGAAWLPDALGNNVPKGANYLVDALLNRFTGQDNQDVLEKAYQRNADAGATPNNEIEGLLRKIGLVQDLPAATTIPEKLSESIGNVGGSILGGGALAKGVGVGGQAIGRYLLNPSTWGGGAAQALAQPAIENVAPDSPKTQAALSLAAGLLGGYGAGKALNSLNGVEEALPNATAGQRGDFRDPRTRELISKQLDITKKDPTAADMLDNITLNQQQNILNQMQPKTPISGGDIVKQIQDTVGHMKAQRSVDYQNNLNELLKTAPEHGVDVSKTLGALTDEFNNAANGSPLQASIGKAINLVRDNAADPQKLMSANSSIKAMAQNPQLGLGKPEAAILAKVTKQLNSDLDAAMPGYGEMNANYAAQTKQLQSLINGTVGKAAKSGVNKPSQIIQNLFEKTDPELAGQLRQALPEGVYNQAADMYLGDVAKRGLQTTTNGTMRADPMGAVDASGTPVQVPVNAIGQYQKMAKILQGNKDTLSQTLPPEHNARIGSILQNITQTKTGRPVNDYVLGSGRQVGVGNEVKGLGIGNVLADAALWLPRKMGLDHLNRQEMLTGVSPTRQLVNGAVNSIPQVAAQSGIANSLADGRQQAMAPNPMVQPSPMPPQGMGQSMQPMQPRPVAQPQEQQISPIEAAMAKHGIGAPVQQGGMSPSPVAPQAQELSPIDAAMQKHGIGAPQQAQRQDPTQGVQPQAPTQTRPLSPAEIEYMTQQLSSGNMDGIVDFDNSFSKSRQPQQQAHAQNDNSNIIMQVKEAAQRAFPDNPTMQKVAMSQAILESGLNGHPSQLATQNHNLFGIKEGHTAPGNAPAANYQTTEYAGGSPGQENAQFSSNNTYDDSLNQYKHLMTGLPRYASVVNAQAPEQAFQALQNAGYATDPNYANKLLAIYTKNVMPLYTEM